MTLRRCAARFVPAALCAALWFATAGAADRSPAAMAGAASTWLAALAADQRAEASFAFESAERQHWGFVPTEMFPRRGLTLGAMTPEQRQLAHDLLKTGLSQRGYQTAGAIISLENILRDVEEAARRAAPGRGGPPSIVRDPLKYYVSVFGAPSAKGTWGWRVEGHHISLNFTVVNGGFVASAPAFFGSNPAEVREGPQRGARALAAEEDSARAFVMALDPAQRTRAVISAEAPNDIATMNQVTVEPMAAAGIAYKDLQPAQRALLMAVIDAYVSHMASDVAADRMARVQKAGLDGITFAWSGDPARGQRHYYRIQGPTFLIEYDNTQNNANHIHAVWRDFQGDFGRDVLREHLKTVAH